MVSGEVSYHQRISMTSRGKYHRRGHVYCSLSVGYLLVNNLKELGDVSMRNSCSKLESLDTTEIQYSRNCSYQPGCYGQSGCSRVRD